MFTGRLEGIYLSPRKKQLPEAHPSVQAHAGRGLEGDRYCRGEGTFSLPAGPDREVTLIEAEAIEALSSECKLEVSAAAARRNLLTRGVPLNHLVGKQFKVGTVVLRGMRLCEPCGHLEKLTVTGIKEGLCHRGGLRAQIVSGGLLRQGDVIEPVDGNQV
jgi:MOSC domain-containing protein YiiM